MAKDLYEENKELKRVLYNIEKAILDFRLTQLDLPLEKSLGLQQLTKCSCTDSEGCNCDEEKEVLNVIEAYSNALCLLDDYDHGCISKPKGKDSI